MEMYHNQLNGGSQLPLFYYSSHQSTIRILINPVNKHKFKRAGKLHGLILPVRNYLFPGISFYNYYFLYLRTISIAFFTNGQPMILSPIK